MAKSKTVPTKPSGKGQTPTSTAGRKSNAGRVLAKASASNKATKSSNSAGKLTVKPKKAKAATQVSVSKSAAARSKAPKAGTSKTTAEQVTKPRLNSKKAAIAATAATQPSATAKSAKSNGKTAEHGSKLKSKATDIKLARASTAKTSATVATITAKALGKTPAAAHNSTRTVPTSAPKQAVKTGPAPAGAMVTGEVPTPPSAPQTPRDIAAKTAEARSQQAAIGPKKPVNQRHGFKTNEFVVYPAHGVGRIVGIEEQEIAGLSLELFVIQFEKDKMTLRLPTGKLDSVGMRKLADDAMVTKAMETLKGRARIKRTMWSRRAQEYEAKINSGDLVAIAEVVRDLYRSESQPEQSYSERQLYEAALDRMAREIAVVARLDERGAVQRITDVLSKSAKGRRIAAEAEEAGEGADFKAA